MADASETLHEAPGELSADTLDMHRALVSLREELEAVDWYMQRAEACMDAELRATLEHNMREEMEHAAMLLEWLRRRNPHFADHLRGYLFSEGAIVLHEEAATMPDTPVAAGAPRLAANDYGFTIGSLKERP